MGAGSGIGFNANRRATDTQGQARESERFQNRFATQQPTLQRAVVTEVFYDPVTQLDDEALERLEDDVKNPDMIRRISRNCILARVITGDADNNDSRPRLFFPMFGPYVMMPVKVGEQVYVMYEDPAVSADTGVWVCRIPEPVDTDDVNYTHGDRRYADTETTLDLFDLQEGAELPEAPEFPNGNPSEDSLTLGGPDEYEKIIERSSAAKQFTPEPVPRWSSRPGDTSIQGSNNTLIALSTDRTGPANNENEVVEGAGTIYIVCGRGQDDSTAPVIVENTREYNEVDKNPRLRGGEDNPKEGDLNFENDLSTIMVSMKTNVDKNFDIDIPNSGGDSADDQPAIALKTTQLRLVGREDVKIQAGDNETGAAIVLRENGDILLIPGPGGVIKLGGDDAGHAPLGNVGANAGGQVAGVPILSTMGGVTGTPGDDPHGYFSTKVLFKV